MNEMEMETKETKMERVKGFISKHKVGIACITEMTLGVVCGVCINQSLNKRKILKITTSPDMEWVKDIGSILNKNSTVWWNTDMPNMTVGDLGKAGTQMLNLAEEFSISDLVPETKIKGIMTIY